ncbi:hypothetical protein LCGC14_0388720 [marine sediment metagenome]|uniref:Uncharacterized protein n=1 Tax=marine sediment metagenome TaxID=412755 RepID=A0A0F9T0D1_9ZZZZ
MAGGLGFADSLTKHIALITAQNTPQFKLNWQGHLNLLKHNKNADVVRINDEADPGHRRTVIIKAKQRATIDMTDTEKSCENVNVNAYFERNVNLSNVRQYAIFIDDETIARYPNDASAAFSLGTPSTKIMTEFMTQIKEGADAILSGVNQDLATLMAANIGVNQRTGDNATTAINLVLNTNNNPLNQGLTQVTTDYQLNEASGRPMMVGTGLIHNFAIQQRQGKAVDQSGINTPIQMNDYDFFQDPFAATSLGANQAIVYEPEAVQLIEYMEYQGYKAGDFGVSTFFTFMLPMQVSERIEMVEFDAQLKYFDCPTTLTDAYYGTTVQVQKGFSLIISKQFGLFTIDQAYRATDRLNGNRGSYRYSFTNV